MIENMYFHKISIGQLKIFMDYILRMINLRKSVALIQTHSIEVQLPKMEEGMVT